MKTLLTIYITFVLTVLGLCLLLALTDSFYDDGWREAEINYLKTGKLKYEYQIKEEYIQQPKGE